MHVEYIVAPQLVEKPYVPLVGRGTFQEDLKSDAGRKRELRTDMISRLRSGDHVRTASVRAFCDGPRELERLLHEITGSHQATIEFVAERFTVTPDDAHRLPKDPRAPLGARPLEDKHIHPLAGSHRGACIHRAGRPRLAEAKP
jgi:hypothetical protein